MTITYNKQYSEQKFDYFVLYKNSLFGLTNVFWEYYNVIKSCSLLQKEEIIEKIQTHKKESKRNSD